MRAPALFLWEIAVDRPPAIIIATDVAARLEAVLEHAQGDAAAVAARLEEELARAELRAP